MKTLILDATTKSLRIKLAGNVTTNQLAFTSAYANNDGTTFAEGNQNGVTNNTTAVDIVSAPSAGNRRTIKSVTVNNLDTVAATIIVEIHNTTGPVTSQIAYVTLAVNETWTLDGSFTTSGALKTSTTASAGGSDTQVQYNSSGSFAGITGATSNGTTLTLTSARATTDFSPTTNDGATLGTGALSFADLFLASGGVINFNNGNYTLTHSTGLLTASGAFSLGTSNAFTTGTIELGHASDTTLSRSSAGVLAVEGVVIPSISSTNTLTNKTIQAGIIDYVIEPASDDTYAGESSNDVLAGDTIAQWDLLYLDATSGRWEFADADAVATAGSVLLALASESGTDGNAINVVFRGVVRNDGWTWSGAGKPLYVSTTAKAMTETAPTGADDVVRVVGYTLSDDAIYFNPSNDWATVV